MKKKLLLLFLAAAAGSHNIHAAVTLPGTSYVSFIDDYLGVKAAVARLALYLPLFKFHGTATITARSGVNLQDLELSAYHYTTEKGKTVSQGLTGTIKPLQMKKSMKFRFNHEEYRIYCKKFMPVEGELKRVIELAFGGEFEPKKSEEELLRERNLPEYLRSKKELEERKKRQEVTFFYKGKRYFGGDIQKRHGKLYLKVVVPMKDYFNITSLNTYIDSRKKPKDGKFNFGLLKMNR